MKYLLSSILVLISIIGVFGQVSFDKESIVRSRNEWFGRREQRAECERMGEASAADNRCMERFPNEWLSFATEFSEGRGKITVNGMVGFIDSKGKVVVKPKLRDAGSFSEGLAPFESTKGGWGFIDKNGNVVIKPQFEWAFSFKEGLALVQSKGLWGFVDKNGDFVIAPRYESASGFNEGTAIVGSKPKPDGKWVWYFIGRDGRKKFGRDFDGISRNFDKGIAIVSRSVRVEGKSDAFTESFVIDASGRELWILDSWYVSYFSDDMIVVAVDRNEYTLLDRNGHRVTDRTFNSLHDFSEGLAAARAESGEKVGFVDKSGASVIMPKFESASAFSEGLAAAEVREGWGYVDRTGRWSIAPKFAFASRFYEGIAVVAPKGSRKTSDKLGYIDRAGNYIWKPTN